MLIFGHFIHIVNSVIFHSQYMMASRFTIYYVNQISDLIYQISYIIYMISDILYQISNINKISSLSLIIIYNYADRG